jgi:prepilin-type N-terminal cleavage/methylation domain-containing protein
MNSETFKFPNLFRWVGVQNGFSFFELIAVLLLISILILVVLSRQNIDNKDLVYETGVLESNIRYVQQLALLKDQNDLRISFEAGTYTVSDMSADVTYVLPNENSSTHLIHSEVEIKIIAEGGEKVFNLDFDKWGGISKDKDYTVTLTDRRTAQSKSFRIIKNTGYIQDGMR